MAKYIDMEAARNSLYEADAITMNGVAMLNNFPAADVEEVKHGRWMPIEYDGYADGNPVWDLWECSKCQEEHSGEEDTLTPYCPNCGAKMHGGKENVQR